MHGQSYYDVLMVPASATPAQLEAAKRILLHLWHPDKHGGSPDAERTTKAVNAAYYVLSDPERRGRYDAMLARSGWLDATLRERMHYDTPEAMEAAGGAPSARGREGAERRAGRAPDPRAGSAGGPPRAPWAPDVCPPMPADPRVRAVGATWWAAAQAAYATGVPDRLYGLGLRTIMPHAKPGDVQGAMMLLAVAAEAWERSAMAALRAQRAARQAAETAEREAREAREAAVIRTELWRVVVAALVLAAQYVVAPTRAQMIAGVAAVVAVAVVMVLWRDPAELLAIPGQIADLPRRLWGSPHWSAVAMRMAVYLSAAIVVILALGWTMGVVYRTVTA